MIVNTPFDIINVLGDNKYNDVPNMDKKRHAFIINRMLSRALPDIAMNMSLLKTTPESTIDYWHCAFIDMSKNTQGLKMLSNIRKVLRVSMAGEKKKQTKIDKELATKFMNIAKISKKEFDVLVEFYEKDLIKYLKEFSKMLETTK